MLENEHRGFTYVSSYQQLKSTRFQIFKWCRDHRKKAGIVWDDFSRQCEAAQLEDQDEMYGERQRDVRERVTDGMTIQLQYWRQRAKGKWIALEDTNSK